jgi:hypothetical protein
VGVVHPLARLLRNHVPLAFVHHRRARVVEQRARVEIQRMAEKYTTAAVTTSTAQKSIDLLLVVIQGLQRSRDVRRPALDIA